MYKKLLLIMLITVFTVSACANNDAALNTGSNSDNSSTSESVNPVIQKVTVWLDAQQKDIKNWHQAIDKGSLIPKPNDPFIENYTFLGWYDNNVNGSLWDFNTPVTKDITLYALWEKIDTEDGENSSNPEPEPKPEEPVTYSVQYNNSGIGSSVETIILQKDTILYDSHLPVLYADGYIFQGWYYNNIKIIAGEFTVTENITLTAKWISHNTEDNTAPAEVADLKIHLENNRPVLTWVNPVDDDFNTVIISYSKTNSTTTYGGHISSGPGMKDTYTLPRAMYDADKYTFTVQTKDYNENKSKGKSIKLDGSVVIPEPEPEPEPEPDFSAYKNQTKWFYGINGPLPNSNEWVRPEDKNRVWTLYWKDEYGWYDANKTSSIDKELNKPIAKDAYMCWAASAANMVHWWMRVNADYIARYDKLNPEMAAKRPDSVYPVVGTQDIGGSIYQESRIFQYFIDHYMDDAGKSNEGFNWFVSGFQIDMPLMIQKGGGGFFEDVFPKGKYLSTYTQGLSKRKFTETFIDAFENNKLLSISVKTTGTSHMMSIWGAEFDEEGYVSAVYIADNNVEQTSDPYDKQLTRRIVRYSTYEGTTASYSEISTFGLDKYYAVIALIIVDLGTQYWEEYFADKENTK